MISTTDPLGHTTTYRYDALNRQTQVDRRPGRHDDHGLRRRRQRDHRDRPGGQHDDVSVRRAQPPDEHDRPARAHVDVSVRRRGPDDLDHRPRRPHPHLHLRRRQPADDRDLVSTPTSTIVNTETYTYDADGNPPDGQSTPNSTLHLHLRCAQPGHHGPGAVRAVAQLHVRRGRQPHRA